MCLAARGASSSGLLPVSCRRSPEGRGCCRQGAGEGGRITQGTSAGGRSGGQWGLGQGLGCGVGAWLGVRGSLPACYPAPTPLPPGDASLRTGQSREVAGRGLLASCLLSQGLISKTGRLVLTEAADGTADVPARLSSWGPGPAPVGCSHTLPSNARAPTTPTSPYAAPPDAYQALNQGPLSPLCQLPGGLEPAGWEGAQESGGQSGCRLTGLVGRVSSLILQMRKLRLREGSELTCVTQWWWRGSVPVPLSPVPEHTWVRCRPPLLSDEQGLRAPAGPRVTFCLMAPPWGAWGGRLQ